MDGAASYLIITHPDFEGAPLESFVRARSAEGHTVKVVPTEQIYAGFSGHEVSAEAIRTYIAQAYREMGARAVLLVGGDTYDYKDNLGIGSISFVPTLYAATDSLVRFAPVDPLFADVDGDQVPDLALGRWPVRTGVELETLVAKTLAYGAGSYARTAVFAADRYDSRQQYSFVDASEEVIPLFPPKWNVSRAYLDGALGLDGAREGLLRALDEGVAIASYFGHSGPREWSFEHLFDTLDAGTLGNMGRPTVVTQWGCWNTYFVEPREDTLGHRWLLSGDRGAAAVLGATTLTGASSESAVSRLFYPRMLTPGMTLGDAILGAKKELAKTQPDALDVLLGWTLLGDPLLLVEP